jgi:hypothetical protein
MTTAGSWTQVAPDPFGWFGMFDEEMTGKVDDRTTSSKVYPIRTDRIVDAGIRI